MQYQPLVTHYCKKFHEAALGMPLTRIDNALSRLVPYEYTN